MIPSKKEKIIVIMNIAIIPSCDLFDKKKIKCMKDDIKRAIIMNTNNSLIWNLLNGISIKFGIEAEILANIEYIKANNSSRNI